MQATDALGGDESRSDAPCDRAFRITFLPSGKVIEVDPSELPFGNDGRPGSVLDIACENGIEIDHACGGVCACSTCHVIVREGQEACEEAEEEEYDRLDEAPGQEADSRLACQCVPDGTRDLVVEIPEWNRNLVREAHH